MNNDLKHYGTPRHSGRYPWGSGEDPYQRNKSFLGYVGDLKKQGLSEIEIAKGLGLTTSQLREKRSIAKSEKRAADAATAFRLKEKGYSNVAIGERMGINESSVRSLLDPVLKENAKVAAVTSVILKEAVDKNKFIDVGTGVEQRLGITRTKLNTAVAMLEEEGYTVHQVNVQQVGTGKYTTLKVLAPPGVTSLEAFKNRDNIKLVDNYSEDGGSSFKHPNDFPIRTIDSNRILVKYREDGGADKDGLIEVRRGVEDISLGNAKYAQVRVSVDGTHYMKGMAMYSDDIPKGKDVVYNISKPRGSNKDEVFKPLKDDPDNPFGASIRPKHYIDKDGKEQRSALNIVNEEGDWKTWSKNLSSQVLSKQTPALAKKQLELSLKMKQEEFEEIMSLTNPAVKKALLKPFSDEADSDAVHLKAAALPRQGNHVLLPIVSMKEDEIYAPNFRNGENVVLIRHPHGGIFEIPELKVNNRNQEAKRLIGGSEDAVGIHPKVAQQLSGADFDGDNVIVIPNKNKDIRTSSPLKGLKSFDTKLSYPPYDGMITIDGGVYDAKTGNVDYRGGRPRKQSKQLKMGDVSNLITDMTIKGANQDEIARAVRHSMVVIDSEKHHLNYKQSYNDNNIKDLKIKYQGGPKRGASTIISKSSSEHRVPMRKEGQYITDPKTGKTKRIYIDPKTGKKLYTETGETYIDRKGRVLIRTIKSTRMAEIDNAFKLSSGTTMENIYATHANALKALANKSRLELIKLKPIEYSPSARVTYNKEVEVLRAKLRDAYRNKPLERQAQLLANKIIAAKRRSNPDMDPADLKKIKGQALEEARARFKAKKSEVSITDREWEAIQAGAVSNNTLLKILENTDLKKLKERATPRTSISMTPSKTLRARSMLSVGRTKAEVADALGVSISTLSEALK